MIPVPPAPIALASSSTSASVLTRRSFAYTTSIWLRRDDTGQ